jgi:hypothetical protein
MTIERVAARETSSDSTPCHDALVDTALYGRRYDVAAVAIDDFPMDPVTEIRLVRGAVTPDTFRPAANLLAKHS